MKFFSRDRDYYEPQVEVLSEEHKHGRNTFFILAGGTALAGTTEMTTSLEAAAIVFLGGAGAAAVEGWRAFHAE